jgi:hypothetical protein
MQIKTNNRSSTYRFTVNLKSVSDLAALAAFRGGISFENKLRKMRGETQLRVSAQGRMGENNPNAEKYRGAPSHRNGYQCIKLGDALFADVYLYNR